MKNPPTPRMSPGYALPSALASLALTLAGCTSPSSVQPGQECPATPLLSSVYLDITGSSYTGMTAEEYTAAVGQVADHTAACSGTLHVATFGESSGQVVTIIDQSFQVDAPTENAVRRKQKKLAAEATDAVTRNLADAASNTPASATDVIGLLRLAAESKVQSPGAMHEVFVFTDGFTNVGVDPAAAPSVAAAVQLAEQIPVPDLSGSALTFAGIGRTASPVPSAVVEQVAAFWERVCERTQADSCTVATHWQGGRS